MKYLTEFRDGELAQALAREIRQVTTRPWVMMEVCGGQTHAIIRNGLDQLLPPEIELVHGPGCPVCVTPLEVIDKALAIAARPGVIFCSFGDMLRVPGSRTDLFRVKSEGGDVRVVYSPLDAVKLARAAPGPAGRLLRHRLRDDRPGQRDGRPPGAAAGARRTSRCWSRTCSCRPPWRRSSARPRTACRRSWPPGTSAASWATGSTRRSPRRIACRSSSPASSRWTSWRASAAPCGSSKPARPGSRTPTRAS